MIIVSNTSPIIAFSKIEKLFILEKLFQQILLPQKVVEELSPLKFGQASFLNSSLFRSERVDSVEPLLEKELDSGEAEAITLAIHKKADWLIIDERKGRKIAKHVYGLNIIGTAGILLKAKKSEIVPSISPIFKELKKINYYIEDKIIQEVCRQVGESND